MVVFGEKWDAKWSYLGKSEIQNGYIWGKVRYKMVIFGGKVGYGMVIFG